MRRRSRSKIRCFRPQVERLKDRAAASSLLFLGAPPVTSAISDTAGEVSDSNGDLSPVATESTWVSTALSPIRTRIGDGNKSAALRALARDFEPTSVVTGPWHGQFAASVDLTPVRLPDLLPDMTSHSDLSLP
jgi:hypothetical protein